MLLSSLIAEALVSAVCGISFSCHEWLEDLGPVVACYVCKKMPFVDLSEGLAITVCGLGLFPEHVHSLDSYCSGLAYHSILWFLLSGIVPADNMRLCCNIPTFRDNQIHSCLVHQFRHQPLYLRIPRRTPVA